MLEANTFPTLVAEKARSQPDLPVLTFEHEGQAEVRTYRQLWQNAARLAVVLREAGVGHGDRLAIVLENQPEFVESMIAAGLLGAVFVPLDPDTAPAEIEFIVKDSGCCGAICGSKSIEVLTQCAARSAALHWLAVVGAPVTLPPCPGNLRFLPLHRISKAPIQDVPIGAQGGQDPMQIIYKSDSSGVPVGVVIRHGRFVRLAKGGELLFGYRPNERPYTSLPLAHSTAQFITLAPALKMGLKAVIGRKFAKEHLWDVLRRHECSTFTVVGGMAAAIYCEPPTPTDGTNPVRFVVSAGMPKALWRPFAERFKVQILEFYGTTEGGITINPIGAGPIGSCGRATPNLVAKVFGDDDQEVPSDTLGEIRFRPTNRTQAVVEYFNHPLASAERTRGGWLRTDDLVTMDKDGWVYFQCRKGRGIDCAGHVVDTSEALKVLAEHPEVSDAFVFGVPSERGGRSPNLVAAVVPRAGTALDMQKLMAWTQQRMDPSLAPQFIMAVPVLPKTSAQRVHEDVLIEHFRERLCPIFPSAD